MNNQGRYDNMSTMISVIVPVYNGEKYLKRCMESILEQTFTDFEVLLIDDGSTDSSRLIGKHYQNKDFRVRFFSKKNGGVSSARNLGLEMAKGKFFTFVDADDYIGNRYLEILLNAMLEKNVDLVISNANDVKENQVRLPERKKEGEKIFSKKEALVELFNSSLFSHVCWGNLYKRSIACKCRFDESLRVAEDGKFLCDYLCRSERVSVIEEQQYYYYYHSNSTVNSGFSDKFFDELAMYFEAYRKFEYEKEIREAIAEKIFRYIKHLMNYQGISSDQWNLLLDNYKNGLRLDCKRKLRRTVKYYWYRIKG